ncbi:MAG TPA: metallophosphoesterase [Candidatus Aphodoplasma excrementigallinarum]|uniref:Metallophosphoesterase n=1 Tax=Candidatus Aphodoplasma excrementigallinarum TaxID=2840673 RepID=A0A9D1SZU4_9FIRM|nr:metallophosphoesterase [Candidatus Aphodoplasma excrementigallinarum]
MWWLYVLLGICVLALAVWALYSGMVVRMYEVKSKKICRPFRIVQVSDLHSLYHGKEQARLMQKIAEQKPDMVVLTGDIFHAAGREDGAVSFLKQIGRYPCFYVLGNHEYRSKKAAKYMELASDLGIRVLSDEAVPFTVKGNEITVAGVNDPLRAATSELGYDFLGAIKRTLSGLDGTKFTVLLAHNHIYIDEYRKYPYDLGLSGHSHGGQFRIPFVMNGFFVKKQGFFPKYAGGLYRFEGGQTHIVSRGVSAKPEWLPRVFNPTELVVVDVVPEA